MDADLFGGALNKSQSSGNRTNGKPTTPRKNTPPAKGNKSPTRGHVRLFSNHFFSQCFGTD